MKLNILSDLHLSFEAIGLKVTAEQAFAVLRPGGTATIIGMIPEGERIELPGSEFMDEKKIQGSNMGSNRFRVDMPRYVDLYLSGRLKLDELVSARIGLEQINDGFDAMRRGEVARSVSVQPLRETSMPVPLSSWAAAIEHDGFSSGESR